MPTIIEHLLIASPVPTVGQVVTEYTPVADKDLVLSEFFAEVPTDSLATVCLIWNYNHATEPQEIIWIITTSGKMPFKYLVPAANVDGTRKLAVVLDNQTAINNLNMSGSCVAKQK